MNKRCSGCGIELQNNYKNNPGYITNIENSFCDRCYQLKHFNKQYKDTLTDQDYINAVKEAIKDCATVMLVVDVCNLHASCPPMMEELLNNKEVILLVNKVDIFPQIVRPIKIINWIENNYNLNFKDIILVSAKKKFNIDEVIYSLHEENIKRIPIVGMTNVGKTSIVNSLIKSKDGKAQTTSIESPFSGTTLGNIEFEVDGITFIDTPGIINKGNLQNYLTKESLNKLYPKKEYKQQIYQLNPGNSLIISSVFSLTLLESAKTSCSIFINDVIKIHRCNADNLVSLLNKHQFGDFLTLPNKNEANNFGSNITKEIIIRPNSMLMVDGLCWMTFNNKKNIKLQISCLSPITWAVAPSIFKE